MLSFQSTHPAFKKYYPPRTPLKYWLRNIVESEGFVLESLGFMLMEDRELLQHNRDYLGHDTFTDIITFSMAEASGVVNGDICISVERMVENASSFHVSYQQEMLRLMAHGVLHLCGYTDYGLTEKLEMQKREDHYIQVWQNVPRGTFQLG
jgi:rRNA maturation RNase YbeY